MSALTVFFDAIGAWFKGWRSAKAGAELKGGEQSAKEVDVAAEEISAELKKKPK